MHWLHTALREAKTDSQLLKTGPRELQQGFICVFARIQYFRKRNTCIRLSLHRCLREVPEDCSMTGGRPKQTQSCSRRVLESSRKASYSHRGIARKPNYTFLLSLCPAAKRHGIRIMEMCLTVNNILGYSIDSCRDCLNQTYFIFDSGQTDCHSGLFCLGSLFFCHPEKESLRAL